MINPATARFKSTPFTKADYRNTPLTGDLTEVYTVSLKFCVGDVWVSTGEVKAGNPDNLNWKKITQTTNTELKLFEEYYSFPAVTLPAGEYKSIKVVFKNRFYRYAVLKSDYSVKYEFLETMDNYTDPTYCNEQDESWNEANYFSQAGNHSLKNGVFVLEVAGEKVDGFTLKNGGTVNLTWRMGAGATDICTTIIVDNNKNRRWDCGVDEMNFECPPSVKYMWDFIVE